MVARPPLLCQPLAQRLPPRLPLSQQLQQQGLWEAERRPRLLRRLQASLQGQPGPLLQDEVVVAVEGAQPCVAADAGGAGAAAGERRSYRHQ